MPSMIYVRHVCDRCGEQYQIEVAPNVETPTLPPEWRRIFLMAGDDHTLLCASCLDGLQKWIGVKPPTLTVVK